MPKGILPVSFEQAEALSPAIKRIGVFSDSRALYA